MSIFCCFWNFATKFLQQFYKNFVVIATDPRTKFINYIHVSEILKFGTREKRFWKPGQEWNYSDPPVIEMEPLESVHNRPQKQPSSFNAKNDNKRQRVDDQFQENDNSWLWNTGFCGIDGKVEMPAFIQRAITNWIRRIFRSWLQ